VAFIEHNCGCLPLALTNNRNRVKSIVEATIKSLWQISFRLVFPFLVLFNLVQIEAIAADHPQ
jgi:hypothetical protein